MLLIRKSGNVKRKSMLFFLSMTTLFTFLSIRQFIYAKEGGAPSGNTGSPGDGQSCAHVDCHTGTADHMDGILSTDVPESGYKAGEFYTITVTIDHPGTEKFGFQAAPQTPDGDLIGDLELINTSQTKFVGGGKYVTHTSTGSNGTDLKTWTFSWTPEDATGDVTFYVAINISNNDDHASGDSIFTSSLIINEDSTNIPLLIDEHEILFDLENPVAEILHLNIATEYPSDLQIEIIDINGRIVKSQNFNYSSGEFAIDTHEFISGIYFVNVIQDSKCLVKEFVKL